MLRRATAFTLTFLFANALNLAAADRPASKDADGARTGTLADAVARAASDAEPGVNLWTLSQTPKRPAALPMLYGTYATLQAMDILSTRKALASGAREANPVMKPGTGTMVAVKAMAGASTIYFSEKLWKRNRVGAIVLMAALNGASAAVVAHNNHNAARR